MRVQHHDFRANSRTLLTAALLFFCNCAVASPDSERISRATVAIDQFIARGSELTARQEFLFSFQQPVTPAELDRLRAFGLNVLGAHVCANRTIVRIALDENARIEQQVYQVDFAEVLRRPKGAGIPNKPKYADLAPHDIRLCGFDARMSRARMIHIRSQLRDRLFAVEVQGERIKKMPINHWTYDE